MTSIGIHRLFFSWKLRIDSVFVHIPGILQTAVVTHTQNSITVIEYHIGKNLVFFRIIPESHHHVLHALVYASHYFSKHIIVAQIVYIKPVRELSLEFSTVVLCALYPLHQRLKIFRLTGSSLILGVYVVIIRESRLKYLQPVRGTVITLCIKIIIQEHAHRVVVVQELPALGRVNATKLICYPRLVMITRYIAESKYSFCWLVVIEIELAKELWSFVQGTAVEQVTRFTVDGCSHIISIFSWTMCLSRSQLSCSSKDILYNFCHTSVMWWWGFGKVSLKTETIHRSCCLVGCTCLTEWVFRLFLKLSSNTLFVTAKIQITGYLGSILEINAVVLYRICKWWSSLQTDTSSHALEVQWLVPFHHTKHLVHIIFRVFVVIDSRLENSRNPIVLPPGNDDITHSVRNTVNCNISVVINHIIWFIQRKHVINRILVNHITIQNLRITKIRIISPQQIHI